MKTILCLLSLLGILISSVGALDSYDDLTAFVRERSDSDFSLESSVVVLGPQYLDEFHAVDEEENHLVARRTKILSAADTQRLGTAIQAAAINVTTIYEVRVLGQKDKKLRVRIVGENHELAQSQLPLEPGDIVIIGRPKEFKNAEHDGAGQPSTRPEFK